MGLGFPIASRMVQILSISDQPSGKSQGRREPGYLMADG
jgi:hypothetical protein